MQIGSGLAAKLMITTGAIGATALRLSIAAIILVIISRPNITSWSNLQKRAALLLGLCMVGMNGCFYLAIARIPIGPAVTFEFLGPLTLSAILSRHPRDLIVVGWALGGIMLLSGVPFINEISLDPIGIGFALLAGVCWALYILATAQVSKLTPGTAGLAIATSIGACLIIPFGLSGASIALAQPSIGLLAIGTAVMASVIPYSLELMAMRHLPTRTFGILLSLEPAMAALVGWLLLGQRLDGFEALGISMVVMASIGSRASEA